VTAAERFRAAIESAFARKTERIEDQVDFDDKYQPLFKREYDTAIGLIVAVKTAETLAAFMRVYLELYERYKANPNTIHFHRSDQAFAEMIERSARVPAEKRDLFREWAKTLDGSWRSADFPSLKQRFDELSDTYRCTIRTFIDRERERRREAASLLDVLRSEYLARNGRPAASDAELDAFSPYPSTALKVEFDIEVEHVATAWEEAVQEDTDEKRDAFLKAFDDFSAYLFKVSRRGFDQLLEIVKLLRDRIARTARGSPSVPPFVPELYAVACLRLLVVANRDLQLKSNRHGFTEEETAYFLRPLVRNTGGYDLDLERRISAHPDKWQTVFAWSKAFLTLRLLARHHSFDLVNLEQTLEIQTRWLAIATAAKRLSEAPAQALRDGDTMGALLSLGAMATKTVEFTGSYNLSQGTIRIGSSLGTRPRLGEAKVIDIDGRQVVVEFSQLKPFLFRIQPGLAQSWLYDRRKVEIGRSAMAGVTLAKGAFLLMGFVPAVIGGGLGGLAYEVGVYLASVRLEEEISKTNPTAGKILGLLTGVLAPRPKFGRKLVVPDEPVVKVLSVDVPDTARSWDDIMAAKQEESRLLADFNKSTFRGALAHKAQAAKDWAADVEVSVAEIADEARALAPGPALATDAGLTFRTRQPVAAPAGGGGRATTRPSTVSPAVAKLQRTKEYLELDSYLEVLDDATKLQVRRARAKVLAQLERGTLRHGSARQQLVTLLNGAKETTGEYVADGFIYSSYKVRSVVDIPRRNSKVPILDRVYEVESYDKPGEVFYIFAEIKGGPRTRLGSVSRKAYVYSATKGLTTRTLRAEVTQADAEWYYQKIIEIAERGNKALARKLFKAAKAGKVESFVIKSGRDLRPRWNQDLTFTNWFKNRSLPYDNPMP
jgi:hypothetical protein